MRKAFSLIEVITVATIIALLATLSVVTYSKIRRQSRDVTRVLNITQMQSALAAYHRDFGSYPAAITPGAALTASGSTYMSQIPTNPLPVEEACTDFPEYVYYADNSGAQITSYHISFCLDSGSADLSAGQHLATPEGIVGQ